MGRSRLAAPALMLAATLVAACGGSGRTAPAAARGPVVTARGSAPGTPDDPPATSIPAVTATTPTTSTPTTSTPATTATTSTTTVPEPPYPLTETTLPLVDHSRPTVSDGRTISSSRALTTLIWAPAVAGRWPLVVFAHGFDITPAPYVPLLESWASAGYVVAAPEFPLTDSQVAGADLDESDIDNQPADIRFVTDSLIAAGSPLAARIDPTRIGIAGHSDGAETVLAASIDPVPAGEPPYRAVIAMSVSPLPGLARTANPPILVTQGDADTINPPSLGYQTWDDAASPKFLDVLHGGGHLPPLEAGSAWLPGLEAVTLAFLNFYVARDGPEAAIVRAVPPSALATLQTG